jgi:hypothetical protein
VAPVAVLTAAVRSGTPAWGIGASPGAMALRECATAYCGDGVVWPPLEQCEPSLDANCIDCELV